MAAFPDALNEQVAHEFAASQQYVAIAVHYDAQTLPHLAAHFYRQAVEERNHAMMLVQYLLDADEEVVDPGRRGAADGLRGRRRARRARARAGARVTEQISGLRGSRARRASSSASSSSTGSSRSSARRSRRWARSLTVVERSRDNVLLVEDIWPARRSATTARRAARRRPPAARSRA